MLYEQAHTEIRRFLHRKFLIQYLFFEATTHSLDHNVHVSGVQGNEKQFSVSF